MDNLNTGGVARTVLNPKRAMPAVYFDRSVDNNPPGAPGGGGGDGDWPLKLVKVDDENVKVVYGTVNGIVPTNAETNINVSGTSSTWSVYLHATLGADGIPTAVAVLSSNSNTVPSDDADNAYMRIGAVTVDAAVITVVNPSLAWSQTFVTCGRDPDDPTTTPGTYYWVVA